MRNSHAVKRCRCCLCSGGDWALGRFGAILIEGAERVSISDCEFTRIDGNGVFLSGYSRNVSVDRCDFVSC